MSPDTTGHAPRRPPFCCSPEHLGPTRAAPRHGAAVGDVVVGFEPGGRQLPEAQRQVIASWVRGWLAARPQAVVVMAHDVDAEAGTRLARLRALSETIEGLGVPRDNLKYTDLPARALPAGGGAPQAVDAVMLSMVETAAPPRAVASCGADAVSGD